MRNKQMVKIMVAGALLATAFPLGAAETNNSVAPTPENSADLLLPPANFVVHSAIKINLTRRFVRLPLHRGSYRGLTVWYVLTDVSDQALATELGINFAP